MTETLLMIAERLGLTPLNLILGVMLYFMGAKLGIFPKIWNGKNDKKNGYQEQIDSLKDHADIANREMGAIKKSISKIEENVAYIKGKIST